MAMNAPGPIEICSGVAGEDVETEHRDEKIPTWAASERLIVA